MVLHRCLNSYVSVIFVIRACVYTVGITAFLLGATTFLYTANWGIPSVSNRLAIDTPKIQPWAPQNRTGISPLVAFTGVNSDNYKSLAGMDSRWEQVLRNKSSLNQPQTTSPNPPRNITIAQLNKSNKACEKEVRHVGFVKVHKAGSTTTMNILQRFAFKRGLLLALPSRGHILKVGFKNLLKIPQNRQFDMLINHVPKYDSHLFQQVLPNDTKYIGIVREPLQQSISAFRYYRQNFGLYRKVPGKLDQALETYLHNRERYDSGNARYSFTNNRMSFDFGLPQRYFHQPDSIRKFIAKLDSEMDFVMILENYTQSLVLFKRKLCWELKDILFIAKNRGPKNAVGNFSQKELAYHRQFSLADSMLYDFFVDKFAQQVSSAGPDFQEEVFYFETVNKNVTSYCKMNGSSNENNPPFLVNETKFNRSFNVTSRDCEMMHYREIQFTNICRRRQIRLLKELELKN